jgi:septal ring factor EnvC (AmiA/AmiB activator)
MCASPLPSSFLTLLLLLLLMHFRPRTRHARTWKKHARCMDCLQVDCLTFCCCCCCHLAANALQAKDKARKDLEKARKVREPLTKKLAEDPNALAALEAEVAHLTAQIAAMQ